MQEVWSTGFISLPHTLSFQVFTYSTCTEPIAAHSSRQIHTAKAEQFYQAGCNSKEKMFIICFEPSLADKRPVHSELCVRTEKRDTRGPSLSCISLGNLWRGQNCTDLRWGGLDPQVWAWFSIHGMDFENSSFCSKDKTEKTQISANLQDINKVHLACLSSPISELLSDFTFDDFIFFFTPWNCPDFQDFQDLNFSCWNNFLGSL